MLNRFKSQILSLLTLLSAATAAALTPAAATTAGVPLSTPTGTTPYTAASKSTLSPAFQQARPTFRASTARGAITVSAPTSRFSKTAP